VLFTLGLAPLSAATLLGGILSARRAQSAVCFMSPEKPLHAAYPPSTEVDHGAATVPV